MCVFISFLIAPYFDMTLILCRRWNGNTWIMTGQLVILFHNLSFNIKSFDIGHSPVFIWRFFERLLDNSILVIIIFFVCNSLHSIGNIHSHIYQLWNSIIYLIDSLLGIWTRRKVFVELEREFLIHNYFGWFFLPRGVWKRGGSVTFLRWPQGL